MTVAEDWLEDMSAVSAKAFHAACIGWRRSTNAFKPSPGQLLARIEVIEEPVRNKLEMAVDIMDREEAMSTADRIGHLYQWLYEIEHLGFAPFEIERGDSSTYQAYLDRESKRLRAEIKELEAQEH